MSYYPELDSYITDKVKVVLNLPNQATKKELDHAAGVDTSEEAANKDFIALKSEVDKLDIIKLANVPNSLNILKTKVDDLDIGKLKNLPIDLKKLSDIVAHEVVKNTKLNTLKTKVNCVEKKIPDSTALVYINQYNTDKQNLDKKIGDVYKKIPDTIVLVTTTVLNTKISEVENKGLNHVKYVTSPECVKLTAQNFASRLKQANLVTKTDFNKALPSFTK